MTRIYRFNFFEYLCDIIGSEEVVRTRREIFSAREILENSIEITSISSGSKAEGLDLKGSDYDAMLLMNIFRVYESLNDVHYDLDNASLVMDTHDTKPGFTKLKLVNKALLEHDVINNWCETVGGETYISSKSFREQDLPDDMVIHGPCWSTAKNNLFENRFVDKEHDSLLNTLRFIYGSPLISVFETFTCQNYRLESANSHGMILSASELSCYCYLDRQIVSSNDISIKLLVKVGVNKELITHMLYVYAREVLESSYCCKLIARNKLFYQQYNRSLCYLKINIRSLPMSAWLLLASLFYKSKRFQECRVIINYFLSRCSPDMIHLNFTNSLVEQTLFKDMKHRCGLLLTFKNLVIINVCFRHPFCLLPDELMPLIHGKNVYSSCCVLVSSTISLLPSAWKL
ncbi:unnamed protein product [Mytilus edulis]|uniref:Uncharacterized protein n=1 Tax=Mytilus edulis TaxID=6550 RepID=A0A8S3SSJ8_MYTED|nr:unnamed protein product [Mytilus edulis]